MFTMIIFFGGIDAHNYNSVKCILGGLHLQIMK
jgi:hypothetical protein